MTQDNAGNGSPPEPESSSGEPIIVAIGASAGGVTALQRFFDALPEQTAPEPRGFAYAELEHLTGSLPPTERAAVVLRYGYDLPYAEIGAVLGSSVDAARAATSSGVRRLRRNLERQP